MTLKRAALALVAIGAVNRTDVGDSEEVMNRLQLVTHNNPDGVRFELAGRLSGMDAETLHQAWQREALDDALRPVIIDITWVTEADQSGRAVLLLMYRFGAHIIAKSPESQAIAQLAVNGPADSAISKPGWFGRLTSFFAEPSRSPFTGRPWAQR